VSSAARALLSIPKADRRLVCQRMIREAEVADVFMRRQRRAHPFWGNGSLMSAARKRLLPDEPSFDDADYCMCFETVLRCLIDRQINSEHS